MKHFIALALVLLTLYLRLGNLPGHMTYEWDQERDMTAVTTMLNTGQPALLGPVVRGESGGFYLGPWYYYLLAPLVALHGESPLTLSIVPLLADSLLVLLLFYLLYFRTSLAPATVVSLLYACSPLVIKNAYTPWNVSLIPLWTLGFVYSWARSPVLLVLLASLSTSIHVSLWPISAVGLIANWRQYLNLSTRQYFLMFLAGLLPLTPLILHDATHQLDNLHRVKFFLTHQVNGGLTITESLSVVSTKLGMTLGRLFTGEPITWIGLTAFALLIIAGLVNRRRDLMVGALVVTLSLLFSLVSYRDADFAEYYFLPILIPLLVMLAFFIRRIAYLVLPLALLLYLPMGQKTRIEPAAPYSLTVKSQVVQAVMDLGYPVEVRYVLPRERSTGFQYLFSSQGALSDPAASHKAYIYENSNLELIAPPEARSIIYQEPIGAFQLVVFSN